MPPCMGTWVNVADRTLNTLNTAIAATRQKRDKFMELLQQKLMK